MVLQKQSIKINDTYIKVKLNTSNLYLYDEKGLLFEVMSFMDQDSMLKYLLSLFVKSEILIENRVKYILESLEINREMGASEYNLEDIIYNILEQTRYEQI